MILKPGIKEYIMMSFPPYILLIFFSSIQANI